MHKASTVAGGSFCRWYDEQQHSNLEAPLSRSAMTSTTCARNRLSTEHTNKNEDLLTIEFTNENQ
uniref:Uncharacterized protein n=1 Tax=Heterorhabditis bacteriophora TaxID=37862 RepID=A0A1I7WIR4_HETBA